MGNESDLAKGRKVKSSMKKWMAPEEGWIKLNCDGAFDVGSKVAGSGVIARNSEGRFVGRASRSFFAICDVQAKANGNERCC